MKNFLLSLLICCFGAAPLAAQLCGADESLVEIHLHTDQFPEEITLQLFDADSVYLDIDFDSPDYLENTLYVFEVCIPQEVCTQLLINDSFGDGLIGQGYVFVWVDGVEVVDDPAYTFSLLKLFNCPPGTSCPSALPIEEGAHLAPQSDFWYAFTPDSIGSYSISTCDSNSCDTKIWVYDTCDGLIKASNEGTVFYDDNEGGCGLQAKVNGLLDVDKTYYIRIGTANGDCGNQPIHWELLYNGPISGCMDPTACNYNPLATIDDGSCLLQGDPNCPDGPDLVLRQDVLVNSLYLTTIETSEGDCFIEENCLQGFGTRDIIRFSTHIENNGELDYFIGDPSNNPDQFSFGNCHGHAHYDGYAEYLLFDENGNQLPIGVKNGFCVLDLECGNGGTAKYGCSFMGISAGCGDIYDSGLDCQWVDVTDVPDGHYTLVTRVNWDNAPDAVGRIEKKVDNNWAQACVILDRTTGELTMTIDPDCPV
ncbi:MAG: lysyl oxidase family protein, partial [Bacteroidota bacterium]